MDIEIENAWKKPAVCVLYTSTLADLETQVAASPYFAAMIATCPCDLLVKIISR